MQAGEEEPLPEGWISRVDPRFNRRFYYHRATKTSTWERPTAAEVPRDASKASPVAPAAAAAAGAKPQKEEQKKPVALEPAPGSPRAEEETRRRQWSMKYAPVDDEQDEDEDVDDAAALATATAASAASAKRKDDEWVRVYSSTHQRHYFYNQASGKTSWLDPRLVQPDVETDGSTAASQGDEDDEPSTPANPRDIIARPLFQPMNESAAVKTAAARLDDNPEDFQRRVMDQFPALRRAFEELEEGQRRLQREREEHEAKVRSELELINKKLAELRAAAISTSVGSGDRPREASSSAKIRRVDSKLDVSLNRFSKDLQRRSLSVVQRRSQLVSATMSDKDALKKVQETANRLSRERGDRAPTKESAAAEAAAVREAVKDLTKDEDSGEDNLAAEMAGVEAGIDYAVREAKAQDAARSEAKLGVTSSASSASEGDYIDEEDEEGGYFRVLGIRCNADEAIVKKAYRRKIIQWHPDKNKDKAEAERMSTLVQTAYKVLSDPWTREIYLWFGLEQYLLHVKVIQCFISYMLAGVDIIKHPNGFGWPRKRVMWLTTDLLELRTFKKRVTDDDKNASALDAKTKGVKIASVTEVRRGRSTDGLRRTGKESRADRYFSIVSKERTLDLEASSAEMADFLAIRLTLMIIDLKRDMRWMKRHYGEEE